MKPGQLMAFKIDPDTKLEIVKVISDTEVEFKKPGDDSGITHVLNPAGFDLVEEEGDTSWQI